jgi:hypothetical protein
VKIALLVVLTGIVSIAAAQQQVQPSTRPSRPQDGGTREVLESIVIPPLPNAPFSTTLETEWARPMAEGGAYTLTNKRHIARDSAGRVYEERWLLVPKGSDVKSAMNFIQIADPNNHTLYTCSTFKKICDLTKYLPPESAVFEGEESAARPSVTKDGSHTVENLGMKTLLGVDTLGTRQTTTIKTGVMGNDRPIQIVLEYWHSPRLGFNLVSSRSDPRIGTQTFTVTELETAEPDPQLFAVPEGYQVVDQQTNPPISW